MIYTIICSIAAFGAGIAAYHIFKHEHQYEIDAMLDRDCDISVKFQCSKCKKVFAEKSYMLSEKKWRTIGIHKRFHSLDARANTLQEKANTYVWWAVLGLNANASKDEVMEAYHTLAKIHHPDKGGSSKVMARLNEARDAAMKHFKAK